MTHSEVDGRKNQTVEKQDRKSQAMEVIYQQLLI